MFTAIVFCVGVAVGYLFPPVGKWIVDKAKVAYAWIKGLKK